MHHDEKVGPYGMIHFPPFYKSLMIWGMSPCVQPLRDKTVLVCHKATLECTVSQARGRVRWFRGDTEIFAGPKYEICNLDCFRTLVIHGVEPADEGLYTCDALDDHSTARLLVEGKGVSAAEGGEMKTIILARGSPEPLRTPSSPPLPIAAWQKALFGIFWGPIDFITFW
uniref:Ig-like domain-containing protein n=1 Tax=Laticauda laticaudata TaxID=8630 RepID=A0A8C5S771_LATLA